MRGSNERLRTAVVSRQSRARTVAARPLRHLQTMGIPDSLRQAPSAELYRLYLAIGKTLDDPRRILETCQRVHWGWPSTTSATTRLDRRRRAP
jgi:hypothetical protein